MGPGNEAISTLCVCSFTAVNALLQHYSLLGTEVPNPRCSSACDSTLKLAIGARVMLTANVDVNGARGEVVWYAHALCSDNQAARAN